MKTDDKVRRKNRFFLIFFGDNFPPILDELRLYLLQTLCLKIFHIFKKPRGTNKGNPYNYSELTTVQLISDKGVYKG